MKFYTKYSLPKKTLHFYNKFDNVDRLSYVDNTQMIMDFMVAGKNLKYHNQGLYKSEEDLNNPGFMSTPVYAPDLAEGSMLHQRIQEEIVEVLGTGKVEDPKVGDDKALKTEPVPEPVKPDENS